MPTSSTRSATPGWTSCWCRSPEGPVFHNVETPVGSRPDAASRRRRSRCAVPDLPEAWLHGAGLVDRAGRGRGRPMRGPRSSRADAYAGHRRGRGSCATWPPGAARARRAPAAVGDRPRADLVGVSHHDVDPATPIDDLWRPSSTPARTCWSRSGRERRPARSTSGEAGPTEALRYLPTRHRQRARPDRCRRHVPGRAPRLGPAAGDLGRRRSRSGSTCGSRPRPGPWPWRGAGSPASPTAARSSCVAPASASGGRSCRRPSRRSARPRIRDRAVLTAGGTASAGA